MAEKYTGTKSEGLKARFEGAQNRQRLLEAISLQDLVHGNDPLIAAFADHGELIELDVGATLIEQGAWDGDLYLILAGALQVSINGQEVGVRSAGTHVGELTGLNPSRPRTATVRASAPTIVLKLPRQTILELTEGNAAFWRVAMDVVAKRLDERNARIGQVNEYPRVFIISSGEGKVVSEQVQANLDAADLHVHIWDKGTFAVSDYPISSLEDAIEAADFTMSVVRGDDSIIMRHKKSKTARDNVHLEYGISLGKLGRSRSILLVCATDNVHLPSDLAGLTTLRYRSGSDDEVKRSVNVACTKAREHITYLGVRRDRRASDGG